MEPKVSVIVPVYNVERYLAQCLDSVLGQTYGDFELICVNDGSTDASRDILGDYARADARVRVIDKANGGLSSARNAGLDAARGDYVAFLDSDDWWDRTMLERTVRAAEDADADVCVFDYWLYFDTTGEIATHRDQELYARLDSTVFDVRSCPEMAGIMGAWDRLYRRDFIERFKFRFAEGFIYEDVPFCVDTTLKAERMTLVCDHLHYYRRSVEGSITGSEASNNKHKEDFLAVQAYAQARFREEGVPDEAWAAYARYFMEYALMHQRTGRSFGYFKDMFGCLRSMAQDEGNGGPSRNLARDGRKGDDAEKAVYATLLSGGHPHVAFAYLKAVNQFHNVAWDVRKRLERIER